MTLAFDVSELGWGVAGFFIVMFFAYALATKSLKKKSLESGYNEGYHDRQHWETDEEVSGKLRRP
jgi:hypothetical protein